MESDEVTDKILWAVLKHIKELVYFSSSLNPIVYPSPSEIEKGALLQLHDSGVIKLINLSRFPKPSIIQSYSCEPEEIKLEVVQPEFNDLYKEFKTMNWFQNSN